MPATPGDLATDSRAEDPLTDVVRRSEAVLEWFESRDIVASPSASRLREFVDDRTADRELHGIVQFRHLEDIVFTGSGDRASATRDLVFEWLREQSVACCYDPEMSAIYDQYATYYIPKYVAIADGYLDGLECEVSGDYGASEPAHLTLTLEGRTYETELEFLADYVDFVGVHDLLNQVLEDTTARRRFYYPGVPDASGAFLPPAAADDVRSFFTGSDGQSD